MVSVFRLREKIGQSSAALPLVNPFIDLVASHVLTGCESALDVVPARGALAAASESQE
jgi:hypothetical protein